MKINDDGTIRPNEGEIIDFDGIKYEAKKADWNESCEHCDLYLNECSKIDCITFDKNKIPIEILIFKIVK